MVYFIGNARWHFCFQKSITVVIHVNDLHLDGMIIKVFQEGKKLYYWEGKVAVSVWNDMQLSALQTKNVSNILQYFANCNQEMPQ